MRGIGLHNFTFATMASNCSNRSNLQFWFSTLILTANLPHSSLGHQIMGGFNLAPIHPLFVLLVQHAPCMHPPSLSLFLSLTIILWLSRHGPSLPLALPLPRIITVA